MRIRQQREIFIDASSDEITNRATTWAAKADFVLKTQTSTQLRFVRGSLWKALYTFDVRKLPTGVTLTVSEGSPTTVTCEFDVRSPITIQTPGDEKRISEHFDLLIAHLTGTLQ